MSVCKSICQSFHFESGDALLPLAVNIEQGAKVAESGSIIFHQ